MKLIIGGDVSIRDSWDLFEGCQEKELFNDMIMFKLTGELKYLFRDMSTPDEDFSEILSPAKYETCVDLGAYNGDTVRDLQKRCENLKKIICFEPDRKNFTKLEKYTSENCPQLCEIYNCAVESEDTVKYFSTEAHAILPCRMTTSAVMALK